jgi:menaquinone-specific isochorismate synthase
VFFSFEVTPRTTPESLVNRLALLNEVYWHGFDCPSRVSSIELDDDHVDNDDDHSQWLAHASSILRQFEVSDLQKVVLAKSQRLSANSRCAEPVNPWPLVAALRDFDPACYQFGFQFTDRYAFVGTSPERLFRLTGRRLESEAVAGTIARGHDETADRELAERLIASAKDQLEHRHVVEAVHDGLARLGANGSNSQFDVARLRTLQHLRSIMSVVAHQDVSIGGILSTLHPTPAVAGVPRESAVEAIRNHEIDARGWYGGPVGWIGIDAAEFAVGIRSALMSSDTVWLYAGAGLVHGSVPEDEWRELQDKLQAFRSAVSSPRPIPQT